jgi:ubiquitin C-terminal hydrolase
MLNEFIVFSIQRFDNLNNNIKNNSIILYDDYIDLKNLFDGEFEGKEIKYKLFACFHHRGGFNEGHYYSIISKVNEWFSFNDSLVEKLNFMEFKSNTVYILFYQKI